MKKHRPKWVWYFTFGYVGWRCEAKGCGANAGMNLEPVQLPQHPTKKKKKIT